MQRSREAAWTRPGAVKRNMNAAQQTYALTDDLRDQVLRWIHSSYVEWIKKSGTAIVKSVVSLNRDDRLFLVIE